MKNRFKLFSTFILSLTTLVSLSIGIVASKVSSKDREALAWFDGSYYSSVTETGGEPLLKQLHNLMLDTHTYYSSYNDCKTSSIVYSLEPGSSKNYIKDFYTQQDNPYTWNGGQSTHWNREHVWCQSHSIDHSNGNQLWGTTGGGSDLHHLRPTEHDLNSTRNNHPYGVLSAFSVNRVGNEVYSKYDNSLGGYLSGDKDVFEPIDSVKGDVARILFYVYTHYSKFGSSNNAFLGDLSITDIVTTPSGLEKDAWDLLITWNNNDPVSEQETYRNNAVLKIQGNRNPFIDHPEYANAIWGASEYITVQSNVSVKKGSTITLTPVASDTSVTTFNYSTSNSKIATVTSDGVVSGVAKGNCTVTITATINSKTVTAIVNVKVTNDDPDPIESIFTTKTFACSKNLWVKDIEGSSRSEGKGVRVTSSTPNAGAHSATEYSKVCKFVVRYCTYNSTTTGTISVKIGSSEFITKAVDPTGADTILRELSFDFDPSLSGTIYFKGNTTSTSIYIYSVTIHFEPIEKVAVKSVEYADGESVSLNVGEQYQADVAISPADAFYQSVTYESSDETIASVSSSGLVTAVNKGNAFISATSNNGKYALLFVNVDNAPVTLGQDIKLFKKVATELTDYTGKYLITSEDYNSILYGAESSLDATQNRVIREINESSLDSDLQLNNSIFEVEKIDDTTTYSIKSSYKNIYIGNSQSNSNSLSESTSNRYANTISIDANGDADIITSSNSTTYHLRFNSSSDQCRFRYFKHSTYASQKPIQLYKAIYVSDLLNDFANNYLHMDSYNSSLGYCNDNEHHYYQTAKEVLNTLDDKYGDIKHAFINDNSNSEYKNRYETWASYNNDASPYVGANVVNANLVLIQTDNSLTIVLILSILSSTLFACGFLVINKKKKFN